MTLSVPILLYDGGCATCSRIANWVAARSPDILVRPVGDDPAELHRLNPTLDIWDAYAVSHVIMPDGTMKLGGEAVAEVLKHLPAKRWFAPCLDLSIFGKRPFQTALNLAYKILDDVRPLLGCDSCGHSKPWIRPLTWLTKRGQAIPSSQTLHFRPIPPKPTTP
jgi:predicted DCC family thiol-disulfide oxidoreductase YuxK